MVLGSSATCIHIGGQWLNVKKSSCRAVHRILILIISYNINRNVYKECLSNAR